MEKPFSFPAWKGFTGYTSDNVNAAPDKLAPPSVNCLVTEDGKAETRMGYEAMTWNLNLAGYGAKAYYMKDYDLTFFALKDKVKYYDHTAGTIVDTGISFTTGTVSRFSEYAGDIYVTNTTNGIRRIVVGRLNGATSLGGNITVDSDMAARLSVFGLTSTTILIAGATENYTTIDVGTGVLTATSSAAYADNTIAIKVQDISSGREKASKLTFWKERMCLMGYVNAANVDQPLSSISFSKFTTYAALENIIDFTYASGGSTVEMVGKGGKVTNIVATEDYLYIFKTDESYTISVADVNTTSGASIPNLRTSSHGCINEDTAADMGNGEIAFITNNRRIMRIKVATDSGAPVVFPDESFDISIKDLLEKMDDDQTGSIMFYHKGKRRLRVQIKIDGVWTTLIYDNNIRAWQPPQLGMYFKDYFERNGILYATDGGDDTIYQIDSTMNDNGAPIECSIATGVFNVDDSQMDRIELKGTITQPTTIYVKTPVDSATVTPKQITGSSFKYGISAGLGVLTLGTNALSAGGTAVDAAEWKKNFDIFPSSGNKVQLITSSFGDSHHYSIKKYQFFGRSYSDTFTPLS